MDPATQDLVRHRAQGRCELCGISQANIAARFHVEHIIARQHGGTDEPSNLALACDRCNAFKGPNLSSIDPANPGWAELCPTIPLVEIQAHLSREETAAMIQALGAKVTSLGYH